MSSKLTHFADGCVSLAKKACDERREVLTGGVNGCSGWLILALYGLEQYFDRPYRGLMGVLREMPRIIRQLGVKSSELPHHYLTVCSSIQSISTNKCRKVLKYSTNFAETGDVQAIDASGYSRNNFSNKYRKRTNYTFKSLKTTLINRL